MLLSRRILLGAVGTLPLTQMAVAAGPSAHPAVAHRLTILHMNDFHSRHLPVDGRALTCSPGPSDCFGSSPRLATAIREQRKAAQDDGRAVVLLDAGDQFQGSLFYTAHHGMAELDVQHAIGTDAMALGNHEFDNGPDTLGRYVSRARFPILSANIDVSTEPALAGRVVPWTILRRAGLRIGLVGLTTMETTLTSSPGRNVRFSEPLGALATAVGEVRAAGAQIIVLLSHLGLPIDKDIATPGVAVIIGGHSHSLLSNDEPGARGPYPTIARGGALVVQAQAYGRYLGRLDLDIAADGTVLAYGGGCRHVGEGLREDRQVAAIVASYAATLEATRRRRVATLPVPLDVGGCRFAPCTMGELAAGALRAAVHAPSGTTTIGLMNAGGLRVGLPAGPVMLGQVLDTMPFGNTLATTMLSGTDLRALARHGLTLIGRGGYPQWAGLRTTLPTLEIEVEQGGTWSAIDPGATYLVATNNFLLSGGDGYSILRDNGQSSADNGIDLAELFAGALTKAYGP